MIIKNILCSRPDHKGQGILQHNSKLKKIVVEQLQKNNVSPSEMEILNHYMSAKIWHTSPSMPEDVERVRVINPEYYDEYMKIAEEERQKYIETRLAPLCEKRKT